MGNSVAEQPPNESSWNQTLSTKELWFHLKESGLELLVLHLFFLAKADRKIIVHPCHLWPWCKCWYSKTNKSVSKKIYKGPAKIPSICEYIYIHIYVHCITLHYITLHYITLHYIPLQLHYIHYITLHYIRLHYTTLHYIKLH